MSKRKKPAYSGGLVLEPKKGQFIAKINYWHMWQWQQKGGGARGARAP